MCADRLSEITDGLSEITDRLSEITDRLSKIAECLYKNRPAGKEILPDGPCFSAFRAARLVPRPFCGPCGWPRAGAVAGGVRLLRGKLNHAALERGDAKDVQPHFHQEVAGERFSVGLQAGCGSGHEVGFLHLVELAGVESL